MRGESSGVCIGLTNIAASTVCAYSDIFAIQNGSVSLTVPSDGFNDADVSLRVVLLVQKCAQATRASELVGSAIRL